VDKINDLVHGYSIRSARVSSSFGLTPIITLLKVREADTVSDKGVLEILELNVTYLDYVVRGKIELAMRQ
jgi:hypothetical protein